MKIREWLKENGLKENFVARKIHISPNSLSAIANGLVLPSMRSAARIRDFTNRGVTLDDIYDTWWDRKGSLEYEDSDDTEKKEAVDGN